MPVSSISAIVHADSLSLDFPARFTAAKKRILLHAAIYNRFAENSAVSLALECALERGVQLEVILLPVWKDVVWMDAACRLIRPQNSREDMLDKAEVSREFFAALAERFSENVSVYEAALFPAFPLVIVDDVLLSGQYAHSQILAPQGLWTEFSAPVERVLPLLQDTTSQRGVPFFPDKPSVEEVVANLPTAECRAAFRLLQEWVAAKGTAL